MKVQTVINDADTIVAGMNISEAIKVYSIYYGLTLQYCEEAIFMGENGKYYSLRPKAELIEIEKSEIQDELSKYKQTSNGTHLSQS